MEAADGALLHVAIATAKITKYLLSHLALVTLPTKGLEDTGGGGRYLVHGLNTHSNSQPISPDNLNIERDIQVWWLLMSQLMEAAALN